MRSDIALYILAAIFFILTVASAIVIVESERTLWMLSTAILGILSLGLGYYYRPHLPVPTQIVTQPTVDSAPVIENAPIIETPAIDEAKVMPTIPQQESVQVEQATESSLTKIKGIGEKRATQLNALGINTIEQLAMASTEDLAKSLKISPKIVAKWVEGAKKEK